LISVKLPRVWSSLLPPRLMLALGIVVFNLVRIDSYAQGAASAAPEDAALGAAVESYFAACDRKDLAGVVALWSDRSPNLAAHKQSLQQLFASEELSDGHPAISRVKVEDEKASLRATIARTSINLKSREKSERRLIINFELVKEAGGWKVWRYAPAAEDLAEALIKTGSRTERSALLTQERELVTGGLAPALLTRGQQSLGRANYDRAKEIYELAVEIAEQGGDGKTMAGALRGIGDVHRLQGDYARALEQFQKSLKISEDSGDKDGIARSLIYIGNTRAAQGDYAGALEQYQKSLKIFEELGNKGSIARIRTNIGSIHYFQGDYAGALEQYRKNLKIFEELGDEVALSGGLNNIGEAYRMLGNYAEALEQYRKSLEIKEEIGDRAGTSSTLNNIGLVHYFQGDYARALEQFQKSLKIGEEIGDQAGIALTLNNIGGVHSSQGDYAGALEQYRKSLEIKKEIGDRAGISATLTNIGNVHRAQGDYAGALEQYRKSLEIKKEIGDRSGISNTLRNIGSVHNLQGDYAGALEQFHKSLEIREEIGDRFGISETLNSIGDVLQAQGKPTQALQFAERAVDLAQRLGNPDLLQEALTTEGKAYVALGQPGRARQSFDAAIASVETLRAQFAGGEQEQEQSFASKISPYYAMVELLIAQNDPDGALNYAERAKARVLLDVLSSGRVNITKAMTGEEQEQERHLNGQLVAFNSQLYREKLRPHPDPTRLAALEDQLRRARLDFEDFQINLYAAHPELKARRGEAPPLRLEEVGALLPDADTALLEFIVADRKTYLFVLTRSGAMDVRVYPLEIKQQDLADRVERFRQMLSTSDNGFLKPARELYDLLIKPAAARLQGKTRLLIVPDGVLWELPFQVLQTPRNRYLIDDHTISYAPSLTVLREMIQAHRMKKARSLAAPRLLAMGNPALGAQPLTRAEAASMAVAFDPLPEAERQVRALARVYGPAHSQIYVGPAASEEQFKSRAQDYDILHLATHGILDDRSPMYSHLLLAPTPGATQEDGVLEARELMKLELRADLVVLSACETARGRVSRGEGMIGLTWALFVAGAPTTLVSQWKVSSESTAQLMIEFHRRLRSDPAHPPGSARPNSVAEALRAAALKLKRDSRYQHPFYWAGFVVVGVGY
jgi:CHAT domain-containing protein/Tfp pilus assembly protein PilF